MTHTPFHTPNHTLWYKMKSLNPYAILGFIVWTIMMTTIGIVGLSVAKQRDPGDPDLNVPVTITVASTYKFLPTDRITYKAIKGVGLTYYCRGDGYTPGATTRSGRYVYEGGIAVSQPLWNKEVFPGDLIWVKATGRWYKAEDTMHEKYTDAKVDIYTHDMSLANSGASKTDIIIMRQPQ